MSTRSHPSSSLVRSPFVEPPSSLSSSSSSSSSSTSSSNKVLSVRAIQIVAPQVKEVRGDDAGNASDRSSSSERPRPHGGPAWVDSKVCEIASVFHMETSVAEFLNKVPVLKASTEESLLAFGPCSLEDRVYRERSSTESPFFFMYNCLFSNMHVSLPFYAFTVSVLWALNMAPSQLHPNTWASM